MRLTVLALCSKKSRFDEKSGLATRNQRINRVSDPKNPIARSTNYIVSGSIGIIKSTQQLTLNHSVFRPPVNSQQSTIIPVQPELILYVSNIPDFVFLSPLSLCYAGALGLDG